MFEQQAVKVVWCGEADLNLLVSRRIVKDEGVFRCLKSGCNILKDPKLLQRILAIRRIFRKHKEHPGAVSIVGLRTEEGA